MRYLSVEEYSQTIDKRNKIRYISLILFCLSVILAVLFAFVSPFGDTSTLTIIIIWFMLSFLFFLFILIRPYFDQVYPAQEEHGTLKINHEPYYEEVRFRLLHNIVMPLLIINLLAIPFTALLGIWPMVIVTMTAIFFAIIWFAFGRIRIKSNGMILSVQFGLFKDRFTISEITQIESIQVRPVKDYLGYGKRLGPDGSIGYIVKGGKAIRLVMNNSKIYVISSNEPDKLVSMLKSSK